MAAQDISPPTEATIPRTTRERSSSSYSSDDSDESFQYIKLNEDVMTESDWCTMPADDEASPRAEDAAARMLAALDADYQETHHTGQQQALHSNHGSTRIGVPLPEHSSPCQAPVADSASVAPAATDQATSSSAHGEHSHVVDEFDPFPKQPATVQPSPALQPLPAKRSAAISAAMRRMPALEGRPAAAKLAAYLVHSHGSKLWQA